MAKTRGGRRPAKKAAAPRAVVEAASKAKKIAKKATAKKAPAKKIARKKASPPKKAVARRPRRASPKRTKPVAPAAKSTRPAKPKARAGKAERTRAATRVPATRTAHAPLPTATQPSGSARPLSVQRVSGPPASTQRTPRESSTMDDDVRPSLRARTMDLTWEEREASTEDEARAERWADRGDALLRALEAHGCARHEYRTDLKDGRFVWLDPDGLVSAEARARVLCSWSRSTNVLVMGWADPLVRTASTGRIDGMPGERDDVSEEEAWQAAMAAADVVNVEHLYRVQAPHAWYFLGLERLSFSPSPHPFPAGTPVALVLRSLEQMRQAIESRAEPAGIVRERLADVGSALLREASFAYRDTDWVSRLERTGRCLMTLANRLPRPSYSSIAAGRSPDEWLTRETTLDLLQAVGLLEDEWSMFA